MLKRLLSEKGRLAVTAVCTLTINIMLFPIKGDHLILVGPMAGFILASVVLNLLIPLKREWREKLTIRIPAILAIGLWFGTMNYFYIGHARLLCNAAEYDHPVILEFLMDEDDPNHVSIVRTCAGFRVER